MPKPPKVKVNETNKYHKKFHDELQKVERKAREGCLLLGRRDDSEGSANGGQKAGQTKTEGGEATCTE